MTCLYVSVKVMLSDDISQQRTKDSVALMIPEALPFISMALTSYLLGLKLKSLL